MVNENWDKQARTFLKFGLIFWGMQWDVYKRQPVDYNPVHIRYNLFTGS